MDDTSVNDTSFKKHSSESIFITEDDVANEMYLDNYKDEDYLAWVSHTKGKTLIFFKKYFSSYSVII